jgi:ataxia telangiectasia mutated family protein
MNKPYNLNAVLHDLKSEKVKERQQGLEALHSVFSRDEVIHSFDKKGTGEAWLTVFQALFTTIGNEKVAYTKKASSKSATSGITAARRLSDAAGEVRWLTERSVQKMNRTVVRCLLTHLLQMMVHSGELLSPVALDYIKALKCVISWTPHLDHLTEDIWVKIVEVAFNVVLGDSLKTSLGGNEDDGYGEESGTLGAELDDSEFYLDDPDENSDESIASTSSRTRKRRRVEVTIPPNRPSSSKLKSGSNTSRPVTLEQIEFTPLLTVLLRSSSAPFLSPNLPHLGTALLRRLQHFLDLYPADTSIYHDYLLALSATISHLSLNKKYDVECFARGAWDGLLRLWGTKNKAMKEDLLVVLHLLFPYFTVDQSSSPSWVEGIRKLWKLLGGEAESRWGVDGLSLESLRLQVESHDIEDQEALNPSPFVARTFRAGWRFDTEQALAWAILELQADCAEKVRSTLSSHRVYDSFVI